MAFLGLTRQKTVNSRAVASLITELAKIDKKLWRRPIEERKALIESMRISCSVPDDLGDLDSQTVELIAKGDGRKTADAFVDAARWVVDANKFVSSVTEERLDSYHADNPISKLNEDLQGLTDSVSEYFKDNGSANVCQDILDETFKRQLPTLTHAFLNAVYDNFECQMQRAVSRSGLDCHWGKTCLKEYESLMDLKKQSTSDPEKQRLLSILTRSLLEGSDEIRKILSQ